MQKTDFPKHTCDLFLSTATNKPDYGLEDLATADLKQKFKMFEQIATEEERTPEPIPVRRSQSLLSKAARWVWGQAGGSLEGSLMMDAGGEELPERQNVKCVWSVISMRNE